MKERCSKILSNYNSLRNIYIMFYRTDWLWHIGLMLIVLTILFFYTVLPAMIDKLSTDVFSQNIKTNMTTHGLLLGGTMGSIFCLSIVKRTLLRYILKTRVLNRVQPLVMKKVLSSPLNYFASNSSGDLLSTMTSITVAAVNGIMMVIEPIIVVFQSLYLAILMCLINIKISLMVIVLLSLYMVALSFLQKRQSQLFDSTIKSRRRQGSLVNDTHRGFIEIKQNALEQPFVDLFYSAADEYWKNFAMWFKMLLTSDVLAEYIGIILPALLLFTAAQLNPHDHNDSVLISLYTLSIILVNLLMSLTQLTLSSASGLCAWKDVMDLMENPAESQEGLTPRGYRITWHNVTIRSRGKYLLKDINLNIEENEKVMICGRSGEGKSTMLKMLPGLLPSEEGNAYVGSVSTLKAKPADLRKLTAFVPQEPYLFETSFRENISYGRDISDFEINQVIKLTQLEAFVAKLPSGLDSWLGPDGYMISGGEKARISLARALLAKPRILILDEATASLDSKTEENIYRHLLLKECTVIGVTHRFSTLCLFPRIIAIDKGKIIFDGPTEQAFFVPELQKLFTFQMNEETQI